MKKTIILFFSITLLIISAEAKKPKKTETKNQLDIIFTNNVDSMSYALGLLVGNDFLKNVKTIPGGKTNVDLIIKGFATSMKGDSAIIPLDSANNYLRNYFTAAQAKDSEERKTAAIIFMEQNKKKEGIITTESGLQYEILKATEGPKPADTDKVKVNYEGFLIDGTKFDSSIDRGEPIVFALNQVIPGWSEGLCLMSVGSKYKFYIPYELAYGAQGAGNVIPPFSPLIFEVELLEINPAEENNQ